MAEDPNQTQAEAQPGLTEPLQERSRRSLEKLLEAAKEVVAERGFDEASVAEIVDRSGLSVGAFYQRFDNKAALLSMVHTRYVERTLAQIATITPERWAGRSISDVVRNIISVGVRNADRDGAFQTACYRQALINPEYAARENQSRRALSQQLATIFESRNSEIGHSDPRLAADFVVRLVAAMAADRFHFHDAGGLFEFSADRMISELLDTCLGYMRVERDGEPPRS